MHFGQAIREFLEKQPDGIVGGAKRLGYSQQSIYPVFKKEDLNTGILRKIEEEYGVSPVEFLVGYGQQDAEPKQLTDDPSPYSSGDLESARRRIAVLEAEKKGLQEQITLLREMVDMLKQRDK